MNKRNNRVDGDKIEARVLRLENSAFKHKEYK